MEFETKTRRCPSSAVSFFGTYQKRIAKQRLKPGARPGPKQDQWQVGSQQVPHILLQKLIYYEGHVERHLIPSPSTQAGEGSGCWTSPLFLSWEILHYTYHAKIWSKSIGRYIKFKLHHVALWHRDTASPQRFLQVAVSPVEVRLQLLCAGAHEEQVLISMTTGTKVLENQKDQLCRVQQSLGSPVPCGTKSKIEKCTIASMAC